MKKLVALSTFVAYNKSILLYLVLSMLQYPLKVRLTPQRGEGVAIVNRGVPAEVDAMPSVVKAWLKHHLAGTLKQLANVGGIAAFDTTS